MNAVKKTYPFLLPLLLMPLLVFGQQVNYSITSDSFAPLAGSSSSASYAQFSAVEPIGGSAAKDSPDFKNFIGFIGQLPSITPLDQDNDGVPDKEEIALGTNINNADSDGDGLTDGEEVTLGTNPLNKDSDGDGYSDLEEINENTNPISTESKPVPPEVVAHVITNKPVIVENSAKLTGTIQIESSHSISGVGFMTSTSIDFENPAILENDSVSQNENQFSANFNNLEPGQTLYIRGFAEIGDKTITGNIVRLRLDGEYLAPFNAVQVDSGWYESSWFGTFKRANYNWIYHTELKWLFVEKSTSLGTWFWSEKLGWGWTRQDLWPYIWTNTPEGWLYYFGNQKGALTFWDYSNSEYLKL